MANMVNPPPFLRLPPAFLKDPLVRAFIEQQNTIIFQLWYKLGGNNDPLSEFMDEMTISNATAIRPAQLFNHQVQINSASDRIESNEIDLLTRPRMADLYNVNQKVNELIDELIVQLESLNVGSEAQRDLISLQAQSLQQVILLNARIEEAFDTKIGEEDIE